MQLASKNVTIREIPQAPVVPNIVFIILFMFNKHWTSLIGAEFKKTPLPHVIALTNFIFLPSQEPLIPDYVIPPPHAKQNK